MIISDSGVLPLALKASVKRCDFSPALATYIGGHIHVPAMIISDSGVLPLALKASGKAPIFIPARATHFGSYEPASFGLQCFPANDREPQTSARTPLTLFV